MGTGWQPRAMITGGLAVADAVIALKGENATSDVVTELAFGAYNKLFAPNRTKVDWLSADESNVDDYIADPLCGADATVGLFRQMLTASASTSGKATSAAWTRTRRCCSWPATKTRWAAAARASSKAMRRSRPPVSATAR